MRITDPLKQQLVLGGKAMPARRALTWISIALTMILLSAPASAKGLRGTFAFGAPPVSWGGVYVGLHGSGGWGSLDDVGGSIDLRGGIFGVHGGYQKQSGSVVYGLEADFDGSWLSESETIGAVTAELSLNWLASLRARLGYAVSESILLFATAGVAFGEIEASLAIPGFTIGASETMTGYVVGGGAEMRFSPKFTSRIEALYYGFSEASFDADAAVVRAGVTWHP